MKTTACKSNAITVVFFIVMTPVFLTAPVWFPVMVVSDWLKK